MITWQWPALAATSWIWPALVPTSWIWPALAATSWIWPALAATSWIWPALTATSWIWPALGATSWIWLALAATSWRWAAPAVAVLAASPTVACVEQMAVGVVLYDHNYRRTISWCGAVCHEGPVTAGHGDNCGSWVATDKAAEVADSSIFLVYTPVVIVDILLLFLLFVCWWRVCCSRTGNPKNSPPSAIPLIFFMSKAGELARYIWLESVCPKMKGQHGITIWKLLIVLNCLEFQDWMLKLKSYVTNKLEYIHKKFILT